MTETQRTILAATVPCDADGPAGRDVHKVLSFAEALPISDDPYERAARDLLHAADGRTRQEAALRLGSAKLDSTPAVGKRLLLEASVGDPEIAARALRNLAFAAKREGDEAGARDHLERARSITTIPDTWPAMMRIRLDIAVAFAMIEQVEAAVSMLQPMDTWLRKQGAPDRMDAPADPELRELAALVSLRLGQVQLTPNPAAGVRALRRALRLGAGGYTAAEAALGLAQAMVDQLGGFGAEIEELYRVAADYRDPFIAPTALVGLGDVLWRSGRPVEAEESWSAAQEFGDDQIADRVSRRRSGKWQRKEMHEQQLGSLHPQRPRLRSTDPPSPMTELGRLASGRTFDDAGRIRRVVVVGAGTGGHYLAPELTTEHGWDVVAYVDDDPTARSVGGVGVRGTIDDLRDILLADGEIDQVIFAIPTASGETRRRALDACRSCRVKLAALPSMFEIRRSHPIVPQLRELRVHETYGDRRWVVDRDAWRMTRGRRVAIGGASSTLGAELARRIAQGQPHHLLLLDEPARPLIALLDELRELRELIDCDAQVVECASQTEVRAALEKFRPEVVFHCGGVAHPRVEVVPALHAVRANTLAPRYLAMHARDCGATNFVLASTGNAAVLETTFDVTKALGELAVLRLAAAPVSPTAPVYTADRVGGFRTSVLRLPSIWAETGTVVERFEKQLSAGGPLTAREGASRVFVHAWEAAQAMLRMLAEPCPGGLHALRTGDHVDMAELARRTIHTNGLAPEQDIAITGYDTPHMKPSTIMVGAREHVGLETMPGVVPVGRDRRLARELDRGLDALIDVMEGDGSRESSDVLGILEPLLEAGPARTAA
jgi:FlaA1/EpsC-like NDP-sugar epimerase